MDDGRLGGSGGREGAVAQGSTRAAAARATVITLQAVSSGMCVPGAATDGWSTVDGCITGHSPLTSPGPAPEPAHSCSLSQVFDFKNFVTASMTVGPASGVLKVRQGGRARGPGWCYRQGGSGGGGGGRSAEGGGCGLAGGWVGVVVVVVTFMTS